MSESLAIPGAGGVAKYASDDAFDEIAKASDFLPRFQLYGSNSKPCQEGKISVGHYGYVVGEDIKDCGKEVRCYPLSYRLKAMRIIGDKVEVFFNPAHPEFAKIKAESGERDTGSLCGPEFLLWLPELGVFVTFFMANKTMRREAPNVRNFCPKKADPEKGIEAEPSKPMTLKSTLIKKGAYAWHGPVTTGCSIPLASPKEAALLRELERFNNPPEKQEETATADEAAATERAR